MTPQTQPLFVACPGKCPAKLRPGEGKRTPRYAHLPLVGYLLACPACGEKIQLVSSQVEPRGGTHFVERGEGLESMSEATCPRLSCGVRFAIQEGRFIVTPREGPHAPAIP